jgi:hypothetical protein
MSVPSLVPDLQRALRTLYGASNQAHGHHEEAHAFLLALQSRNLRRRGSANETGSTWLACLYLLLTSKEYTERLFCAQTLLHRMRRTKLVEAIDWEFDIADVNEYKQWIAALLSGVHLTEASSTAEEACKGELSLLTLAALIQGETNHQILYSLGASIAVLALRLQQDVTVTVTRLVVHSNLALTVCLNCIPDTLLGNDSGVSFSPDYCLFSYI